jgi:hypothetical protein
MMTGQNEGNLRGSGPRRIEIKAFGVNKTRCLAIWRRADELTTDDRRCSDGCYLQ